MFITVRVRRFPFIIDSILSMLSCPARFSRFLINYKINYVRVLSTCTIMSMHVKVNEPYIK